MPAVEQRDGERVYVVATVNKRAEGGRVNVTVDTDSEQQGGVWVPATAVLPLHDDLAAENAALRIAVEGACAIASRMAKQAFAITRVGVEAEARKLLATCDFALAPGRGAVVRADMASWSAKVGRQKARIREQDGIIAGLRGTIAALGQQLRNTNPLIEAADAALLAIEAGNELILDVTDDRVVALRAALDRAHKERHQRGKTRKG